MKYHAAIFLLLASSSTLAANINPAGPQGYANSLQGEAFFNWELTYDPDPFLYAQFSITNASAFDKSFQLGANLLIDPQFSGSVFYGGSINATVFDHDNSGSANLSFNNDGLNGIYKGGINGSVGVSALDLLVGSEIECFSSGCSAFAEDTQGLAGNTVITSPPHTHNGINGMLLGSLTGANDELDIDLDFILSAGDKATFKVYYEVAPVPLPAAIWLFGSAFAGILGLSRRRII